MMKQFSLTLFAVALAAVASADDFDDAFSDDVFGDDPFADIDVEPVAEPSALDLTHQLSLHSIVNINSDKTNAVERLYSGVTSVKAEYRPSFTYQPMDEFTVTGDVAFSTDTIFWLRGDDDWSSDDIDARQYDIDVKEATAQYRAGDWQFSSGIQTVTLGLADALSVANNLYAQNLSVPGTTDLDDTVKPAWTTVISGALGPVRLKTGVVHTHEVNDIPVLGTDFDVENPTTGLTTQALLEAAGLSIEPNDVELASMAAFASFSGVIGPLDWQANAVSQLSHTPVIELGVISMGPPPVIMPIALHYPRINSGSVALSYVTGSFLWKLEGSVSDGLQAQSMAMDAPSDLIDYQRAAGTFGFDFDHSTLGRLIAEIQYGTVLDYDSYAFLDTDESSVQWALMYNKSFLRESLTLGAQMIGFDIDADGGLMQAINVEYDVSDRLMVSGRYVNYVDGSFQFLNGADDRDRVLASVQYTF